MIEITENNISTIAVFLYSIIGPSFLVAYGIDENVFTTLFVIIVGLILNFWSSSRPNTIRFLGNEPDEEVGADSDAQ